MTLTVMLRLICKHLCGHLDGAKNFEAQKTSKKILALKICFRTVFKIMVPSRVTMSRDRKIQNVRIAPAQDSAHFVPPWLCLMPKLLTTGETIHDWWWSEIFFKNLRHSWMWQFSLQEKFRGIPGQKDWLGCNHIIIRCLHSSFPHQSLLKIQTWSQTQD